jgi:DNA-directed RNA polymerase specialized sigma24 family protein
MNFALLRRRDRAEWDRCYDKLWSFAIAAARRFLFGNVYSDHDREDLASKVMSEFQKTLCRGRIPGCRTERNAKMWIWGRSRWRAITLRQQRRRENELFDHQHQDGNQGGDGGIDRGGVADAPAQQYPINYEARLNELIAWARMMPAGFSINEEEAYRAVVVRGLTTEECARELVEAPGTVGRRVWTAKRKIAAVLEQERRMFL